jgi:uncharacterized protein YgiM (DUF1202 family)
LLFIESALIFCILTFIGIASILKRKNKTIYFPITLAGLFCFGVLYLNNFVSIPSVITSENKVYLMEGPSAGASVSGIVSSGNQLQVLGKEDVWLKVKWMDKKVFVKESSVLHVNL